MAHGCRMRSLEKRHINTPKCSCPRPIPYLNTKSSVCVRGAVLAVKPWCQHIATSGDSMIQMLHSGMT
jgi:hypothetical protein